MANDVEDPREVVPINFKLSDKLAQVVTWSQAWKQWEQEEQTAKSQPQPEEKMENNSLEPQNAIPIPVNQVGHAPEVTQTWGAWVPVKPWAIHRTACKQIEEDYPLLEDILNPILVDITLSGKYPDTPVNADELASVEVLPEFSKPRKQLVGAKDWITLMYGTMPKQQHFIKLIRKLATSAVKQYNLPMMLHNLAAAYAKSPEFSAIYNYIKDNKIAWNSARQKMQEKSVDYVLVNNLLFKMVTDYFGEDTLVLCIPKRYIPMVLYQYHDM